MKTTIDIADDLISRARQIQKREDITLRALVEEGLRLALEKHAPAAKKYKFRPIVVGKPYQPGMPVKDVPQLIRDSYAEREDSVLRIAERQKSYGPRAKSRKKQK